ncbi:MAG: hypothetical protein AAGM04_00725 [Pseudomonadota bacterium]
MLAQGTRLALERASPKVEVDALPRLRRLLRETMVPKPAAERQALRGAGQQERSLGLAHSGMQPMERGLAEVRLEALLMV